MDYLRRHSVRLPLLLQISSVLSGNKLSTSLNICTMRLISFRTTQRNSHTLTQTSHTLSQTSHTASETTTLLNIGTVPARSPVTTGEPR